MPTYDKSRELAKKYAEQAYKINKSLGSKAPYN